MTRKSPIKHRVRQHKREGKVVESFTRGRGTRRLQKGEYVFRKRLLHKKSRRLKTPEGDIVSIDAPIANGIKKIWQKGWRTSGTCSSHIGEWNAPFVDFSSIPLVYDGDPDYYKLLSDWFGKKERSLKLNYDWSIEDGSIFLVDASNDRINDFVRPVSKNIHKNLVDDLNKIADNLPRNPNMG